MPTRARRPAARISTAALVLASLFTVGPATTAQAAGICDDVIAPTLAKLTDSGGGAGVREVFVDGRSPTLQGMTRTTATSLRRSSGTASDGTWTGTLVIPRYTNNGTWKLSLYASDRADNVLYLASSNLTVMGEPGTFSVKSNPDLIKPKVSSFSYKPKEVDTRGGAKSVTVVATVTDKGGSKVRSVSVSFGRAVSGKGNYGAGTTLTRVKGTNKYKGKVTIPKFADRDTKALWRAALNASDGIFNSTSFDAAALKQRGWPSNLTVFNKSDSTPPLLKSWNRSPKSIDVATGDEKVALSAKITDDRSGPNYASVVFQLDGGFESLYGFLTLAKTGFKGTPTVRACATAGKYVAQSIRLYDRTGNYRSITTAQLTSRSFPVNLQVAS